MSGIEINERTFDMTGTLEHANITVRDPDQTAAWLAEVFGWHIRWRGGSAMGGHSIHIGSDDSYLAIYSQGRSNRVQGSTHKQVGGLNHVGITVDDLDAVEAKVKAAGFETHDHGDYEPGRRFYFSDPDSVEFEVVSYA